MVPVSQKHQRQRRVHQGRYRLWWCYFELLNNSRWLGKNGLCSYVDLDELVVIFFLSSFRGDPLSGSSYLLYSLYTVCRSLIGLYEAG